MSFAGVAVTSCTHQGAQHGRNSLSHVWRPDHHPGVALGEGSPTPFQSWWQWPHPSNFGLRLPGTVFTVPSPSLCQNFPPLTRLPGVGRVSSHPPPHSCVTRFNLFTSAKTLFPNKVPVTRGWDFHGSSGSTIRSTTPGIGLPSFYFLTFLWCILYLTWKQHTARTFTQYESFCLSKNFVNAMN